MAGGSLKPIPHSYGVPTVIFVSGILHILQTFYYCWDGMINFKIGEYFGFECVGNVATQCFGNQLDCANSFKKENCPNYVMQGFLTEYGPCVVLELFACGSKSA